MLESTFFLLTENSEIFPIFGLHQVYGRNEGMKAYAEVIKMVNNHVDIASDCVSDLEIAPFKRLSLTYFDSGKAVKTVTINMNISDQSKNQNEYPISCHIEMLVSNENGLLERSANVDQLFSLINDHVSTIKYIEERENLYNYYFNENDKLETGDNITITCKGRTIKGIIQGIYYQWGEFGWQLAGIEILNNNHYVNWKRGDDPQAEIYKE